MKSLDYLQREFSVEECCELCAKLRADQAVDDKVEGTVEDGEEAGEEVEAVSFKGDVVVLSGSITFFNS